MRPPDGATAPMRMPRAAPLALIDHVRDRLTAILASPTFRRLATRFPLTRPIARRRARALFDLCAGFAYSQVLSACIQLDLFAILHAGPQTPAALAVRLRLPPDNALRLLRAAASLRLLAERRDGRFALGPLGAALIGNPGIAAMVAHHAAVYDDLKDPVALLRGEAQPTNLQRYWAYAETESPDALATSRVAAYTALMAASQPLVADEILDAYPPGRHSHWLDVGGGDGSFIAAAASRAPHLAFTLFDLPGVVAQARVRLAEAGLAHRVSCVGGSFLSDPLPRGADVISLVRVIHDHDDEAALRILGAVRAALPPNGILVLAEPLAAAPGASPVGDAYFGFYLLAMGQGRARRPAEIDALLRKAGFGTVRHRRTRMPLLTGLVTACPHS